MKAAAEVLDVYVRVSKVGGRSGDSYRSPALQRAAVHDLAKREGWREGKVITDEDVSGGKAHTDRGLEELIRRAERGASAGVMVDTIDRFGRTMVDGCLAMKRLADAGARIVSAEGDDSAREGGKKNIHFRLLVAEDYLENVTRRWSRATGSAAAEGIQCGRTPIGYVRGDDRRLVVDPPVADAVRKAFEMRAHGASFAECSRAIEDALGRKISVNTFARMVGCRTYLGEINRGDIRVAGAHESIVTPELFAAAGAAKGKPRSPRKHSAAEETLLSGVAVCASCGGTMKVQHGGHRPSSYVCQPHRVGSPCAKGDRAAASVAAVDGHVREVFFSAVNDDRLADKRPDVAGQWIDAKAKVQEAEAELEACIANDSLKPTSRIRLIEQAEAEVEAARAELFELAEPDLEGYDLDRGLPVPATHDAYRRMIRKYIREVRVSRSDPKRRRWQPIGERVEIVWQPGVRILKRAPKLADAA